MKAPKCPLCPLCKKSTEPTHPDFRDEFKCGDHYTILYDISGTFEYKKLWNYTLEMIWQKDKIFIIYKDGEKVFSSTEEPPVFNSKEELENWILF